MIIISIVGVVLILVSIGAAMAYFYERDNVNQVQEDTGGTQNVRVKEAIKAEYDTNTKVLSVENTGALETVITGVMIHCDSGRVYTETFPTPYTLDEAGAHDQALLRSIEQGMDTLKERC